MKVCDINKTGKIVELFSVPADKRDGLWKKQFFDDVFDASFACGTPQIFNGPDGFPYFQLSTPEPYKAFDSFCICNLLEQATNEGFGIAINPREDAVDWVFSCGDLLCYRLFGAFDVGQDQPGHMQTLIQKATQVLVGAPAETILPAYTRRILKMFIEQNTGDKSPGVFLMNNPSATPPQSLVFSIFKEDFPDEATFNSLLIGLSWFLPRHYPPTSIPRQRKAHQRVLPVVKSHDSNADTKIAVFLDRDGVINRALEREGKPYPPRKLAEFEILPEVSAACAKLKAAGFVLVVATNQPDVGRGTLKQEVVEQIHAHMLAQLPIDRVEVCYHPGKGASDCDCRKPRPGMLRRAARELNIDLRQSWMVGDRWRDVDCGHAAGCKTIFIDRGYSEELKQRPDFSARNLAEAADIILARHI